ncbi:conserved Plasmodium protein, unknown function [Plasmodium gallinaceum]|uniref:Uncharacterized protein n=1 Tax=Plasmodium gallinaceum TaxID=5849 RepID=A0A1J1H2T8_PLAGA|nr:conserved Plasmodium protein, unknown function [Plasmodium gallinaceum]CRG97804.1 conserved Plasmodium protein, unknown function [Plasmodium gallinaceum]
MFYLCPKKLGGGVGRRLCMPIYSGSSDSVFKYKNFVLKKIKHKYENVLLFGDIHKLRMTAEELIKNVISNDNIDNDYNNYKLQKYMYNKTEKIKKASNDDIEKDKSSKNKNSITKKLSFWQIYSIRVKKNIHLLNFFDFALILQSFHLYNKDTGIYVSSIKYIEDQIPVMNGISFVIILNILSKRLKKNNYNEFFKKMMNYLPNILYELNLKDMSNILNCFYNLELNDKKVCELFYLKILSNINKIDALTLSSLCYIFYKYNFENIHFFECLKKTGFNLLDDFDANQFYKFIFSLYKKKICLKEIIEKKKNDILSFLPNYSDEEKLFICEIFNLK